MLHPTIVGKRCTLTLEGKPKVDQEWMGELGKNFHFPEDILESVASFALPLVHVLHRVQLLRVVLLDDAHLMYGRIVFI